MTNYKRYNNMFLDCHWLIPVQLIPIFFAAVLRGETGALGKALGIRNLIGQFKQYRTQSVARVHQIKQFKNIEISNNGHVV